jgi:hypothetical protein
MTGFTAFACEQSVARNGHCAYPRENGHEMVARHCHGPSEIRYLPGRLRFGGCKHSAPFPALFGGRLDDHLRPRDRNPLEGYRDKTITAVEASRFKRAPLLELEPYRLISVWSRYIRTTGDFP